MKNWIALLLLVPCLAHGQTYSSVSAGTGISISNAGAISNTSPIVGCANNEIVFQNASGLLSCDPTLQWSTSGINLTLGNGSAATVQTSSAGATSNGGSLSFTASSGGGTSGNGGSLNFTSGYGQGTSSGAGGGIVFTAGSGSVFVAANGNISGGTIGFTAGNGGGTTGNTTYTGSSAGGNVLFTAGNGGNQITSANGGRVSLQSGYGGSNTNSLTTNGGTLVLTASNAGSGTTTANAGNITLTGGNGGTVATSSATGSSVLITAGNGGSAATTNTGGSISLKAGLGGATANNGSVNLQDGNSHLISRADGVTDNFVTYYGVADGGLDRLPETTGFSYQIPNNVQTVLIHATGTLATGTLTLPTTPVNGQLIRISADQTITSLTITPSAGQTTAGSYYTSGATLTSTGPVSLQYCTADTEWYVVH